MNATQGDLVSTIIGMYPRPCRVAIPVIVVQIGLQRLHELDIFVLHICHPFVLFDLCTVFTCFVVCTVCTVQTTKQEVNCTQFEKYKRMTNVKYKNI